MSELREALKKGKNQHRPREDEGQNPKLDSDTYRPHMHERIPSRFATLVLSVPPTRARGWVSCPPCWQTFRGTAHTREGMGTVTNRYGILIRYRPHARVDGVTFLSRRLGRDSRAVRALAYVVIWAEDSTSRKQARRTGQTERNANGGRLCLWESE